MVKPGDIVEVEVESLASGGRGRARVDDRELLVPGLFPGERGRVRIEALARHSKQAHGRLRELLRPSPARRELPCPRHRHADPQREPERAKPACDGCPLMALEIHAQRELERARLEAEHGLRIDGEIRGGEELGYRWSSKRVVAGRPGRLRLGSRVADKREGGRVADMHGCLVDHPSIRAAFDGLEQLASELGVVPWDHEGDEPGDLRYVWAKTNGEQVLLTLVTGSDAGLAARELGPQLVDRGLAAGVALSVQRAAGNAMRGEGTQLIAGLPRLPLELCGLHFELGPLGFLQPNPLVAAMAYRDLVGPAPGDPAATDLGGELAMDLYAGAGVTTALLRERFAEVVACESHPESAAALGIEPDSAESFTRGWIDAGREAPELVVANPPRAGLGEQVCASLLALGAPRLHLMSCSARTLAQDLHRLEAGYELVGLRGYDTLPQTPHLELVAWLRRL
jgi:23S rRNA (uracil1939-C5)-methyltransferase